MYGKRYGKTRCSSKRLMRRGTPNKPSPNNYFDSLFTSKLRQDPLQNELLVPSVKTVTKGKDYAKYLGVVTWNSIPCHIRHQDSLEKFRDLIKNENVIVNVNHAKII